MTVFLSLLAIVPSLLGIALSWAMLLKVVASPRGRLIPRETKTLFMLFMLAATTLRFILL